MATSGTYTVTITANNIIRDAYLDLGAIDIEETPTAAETKLARRGLNYIVKQLEGPPNFMRPGLKMWQLERGLLTLKAQNSYDLKPSAGDLDIQIPMDILDNAVLRNTSTNSDTPMKKLTLDQYRAIGNKSSTITPTQWYYEKRIDTGKLYLNGIPTTAAIATYKMSFVYRQPLEVISANTNEFDIELGYWKLLEFELAKWLAPKVGKTISKDIINMAAQALAEVETFQPEEVDMGFEPERYE